MCLAGGAAAWGLRTPGFLRAAVAAQKAIRLVARVFVWRREIHRRRRLSAGFAKWASRGFLRSAAMPLAGIRLRFEALGGSDAVFFPQIIRRRGFICSRCGGRVASLTPDWRGMRAPGMGRM
jgi:hypothetical protein